MFNEHKKDSWNYYLNTGWYFNQWVRVVCINSWCLSFFLFCDCAISTDSCPWRAMLLASWDLSFKTKPPRTIDPSNTVGCFVGSLKLVSLLYNRIRNSVWVVFSSFLPVAYHFAIGNTSTNGQFPSQLLLDYRSFVYATLHLATTPWATLFLIPGDSIRELWIHQLKVTFPTFPSRVT